MITNQHVLTRLPVTPKLSVGPFHFHKYLNKKTFVGSLKTHWEASEDDKGVTFASTGFFSLNSFQRETYIPIFDTYRNRKDLGWREGAKLMEKNFGKKNEKSRMELIRVCRHYLDSDWIRTRMCMCVYVCVFVCSCMLASVPSVNIEILEMFKKKGFDVISLIHSNLSIYIDYLITSVSLTIFFLFCLREWGVPEANFVRVTVKLRFK